MVRARKIAFQRFRPKKALNAIAGVRERHGDSRRCCPVPPHVTNKGTGRRLPVPERRFPDPWSTEETNACFMVQDGAEIEMLVRFRAVVCGERLTRLEVLPHGTGR